MLRFDCSCAYKHSVCARATCNPTIGIPYLSIPLSLQVVWPRSQPKSATPVDSFGTYIRQTAFTQWHIRMSSVKHIACARVGGGGGGGHGRVQVLMPCGCR